MFFHHNVVGICWTIFILLLCLIPGKDMPGAPFFSFDKFFHVFVFAVFVFQWTVGLLKQRNFKKLQMHAIKISILSGILYGILIELFQGFVFEGRSADYKDAIANAIGCALGYMVFKLIYGACYKKYMPKLNV